MAALVPKPQSFEDAFAPSTGTRQPATTASSDRVASLRRSQSALDTELAGIGSRTAQALEGTAKAATSLKPPTLTLPPLPKTQSTNPVNIWGSAAMMMAAVGSLMTRQPLTTAMNAAADVLHAFRKNDIAQAQAAYETWKISTDNALKIANFQEQQYKEALAGLDRADRTTLAVGSAQERNAIARFNALARAFQDETAAQVADQHGVPGVEKLLADRARYAATIESSKQKLDQLMSLQAATTELMNSPEWKAAAADPVNGKRKQLQMLQDLQHKSSAFDQLIGGILAQRGIQMPSAPIATPDVTGQDSQDPLGLGQ